MARKLLWAGPSHSATVPGSISTRRRLWHVRAQRKGRFHRLEKPRVTLIPQGEFEQNRNRESPVFLAKKHQFQIEFGNCSMQERAVQTCIEIAGDDAQVMPKGFATSPTGSS